MKWIMNLQQNLAVYFLYLLFVTLSGCKHIQTSGANDIINYSNSDVDKIQHLQNIEFFKEECKTALINVGAMSIGDTIAEQFHFGEKPVIITNVKIVNPHKITISISLNVQPRNRIVTFCKENGEWVMVEVYYMKGGAINLYLPPMQYKEEEGRRNDE